MGLSLKRKKDEEEEVEEIWRETERYLEEEERAEQGEIIEDALE